MYGAVEYFHRNCTAQISVNNNNSNHVTNYLELLPGKHVGPAIVLLLLLIHLFVCLFFGKLETNLATERIVRGPLLLKKGSISTFLLLYYKRSLKSSVL